jgi:hypothetical protein
MEYMQATLCACAPQKLPSDLLDNNWSFTWFSDFLKHARSVGHISWELFKAFTNQTLINSCGEHYTQQLSVLSMNYCSVNQQLLSIKVLLKRPKGRPSVFIFLFWAKRLSHGYFIYIYKGLGWMTFLHQIRFLCELEQQDTFINS